MRESPFSLHNLEWPPDDARLAGPVAWLHGWVVGRPGHDCVDLRVRHAGGVHLGVLGLPRTDLVALFPAARLWLPAGFIVGVPVTDGPATLTLEVMDTHGTWRELRQISLTIAPDGSASPRVEGRLETRPDGTCTMRDAPHPFHGHLDQPGPEPVLHRGRAPVFGWLLDETQPLAAVLATTDTLVFNHVEHSLTDDALAGKVPQHPGARHARLRGAVDFPATLVVPACLRVYAVSPDGAVHLCFAQRLKPAAPTANAAAAITDYPGLPPRALPALPSGRPRRLLLVIRTLLPDDSTLRALDLARHLTASHHWAARVIATEDGSLRHDFEQTGVESLIINPLPLLAAGDAAAATQALTALERQVRWDHLDAVAVFDPVCGWALALARRRHIPGLFDCLADEPMQPDPTAAPAVQALLRESWRTATALCFGSAAAAHAQQSVLGGCTAVIIPQWHSPQLPSPAPADAPRTAFAPLRTVDWLQRHHPATAARWRFHQGPAVANLTERLVRQDDAFNASALTHRADWNIAGFTLCLGPLFDRGPLRPVLDAAAAGIPLVAPRRPTTAEFFAGTRQPLVAEDNPVAFAHALLAADSPAGFPVREIEVTAAHIRGHHAPPPLLSRWEDLLASVAATRG